MGQKMMTVCDQCGRPPNGDSPDCVRPLPCGHEICDECEDSNRRHKFLPCRVCFDKAYPGVTKQKVWCPNCNRKTYGCNWYADASGKLVMCGICKKEATPIVITEKP